jgi:hypothetical protein
MRGRDVQFADITDFDVDCLQHKRSILLGVAFKVATGPSFCGWFWNYLAIGILTSIVNGSKFNLRHLTFELMRE